MKLIDVSYHNGAIDWKKVKSSGIEGVIIRAGYGQTTVDKKWKDNIKGALEAGLAVGVYWFSYAWNAKKAEEEATKCMQTIKAYKKDLKLPVFFDWEYDSMDYAKKQGVTPDKKLITEMTVAFCNKLRKNGYNAGVYYNEDYRKNFYDLGKLGNVALWYARYTKTKPTGVDFWQNASDGTVNGIKGNVDMDVMLTTKWLQKDEPEPKAQKDTPKAEAQKSEPKAQTAQTCIYYTIKKGDNLTKIAKAYNTTVAELVRLNNIKNPNLIIAGKQLIVRKI